MFSLFLELRYTDDMHNSELCIGKYNHSFLLHTHKQWYTFRSKIAAAQRYTWVNFGHGVSHPYCSAGPIHNIPHLSTPIHSLSLHPHSFSLFIQFPNLSFSFFSPHFPSFIFFVSLYCPLSYLLYQSFFLCYSLSFSVLYSSPRSTLSLVFKGVTRRSIIIHIIKTISINKVLF